MTTPAQHCGALYPHSPHDFTTPASLSPNFVRRCPGHDLPGPISADEMTWRRVAVALAADLADLGADPTSPAVLAYHHARNGRYTKAMEALQ